MSRFERTPGAALGPAILDALYADISESSAAASKWDPLQRPKPNPEADISKASREPDVGAPPCPGRRPEGLAARQVGASGGLRGRRPLIPRRYSPKGELPDDTESIKLNRSQEAAMRLVLERRRRFSLIQGPPGTGKTTTAVSMICGWLRHFDEFDLVLDTQTVSTGSARSSAALELRAREICMAQLVLRLNLIDAMQSASPLGFREEDAARVSDHAWLWCAEHAIPWRLAELAVCKERKELCQAL
eukprot:g33269.t1